MTATPRKSGTTTDRPPILGHVLTMGPTCRHCGFTVRVGGVGYGIGFNAAMKAHRCPRSPR